MNAPIPLKKLFRIASRTSTVIAILTIAPIYVIISILNISDFPLFIGKSVPFKLFLIMISCMTLVVFIIWLLNIFITFLQSKRSYNSFTNNKKYILSYFFCLLLILAAWSIQSLIKKIDPHQIFLDKTQTFHFMEGGLIIFTINTVILILQDLTLARETKAVIELENAQLKIKNIEAVLGQLKQQIHPHFLFNSLNTLKTLIKKDSDNAEKYLLKLSDFLIL
jgi:two-component system LytT family sensor kinase